MTELLEKIKGWLTLGAVPLIGVFVFTGLFVFSSPSFLSTLGLLDFYAEHKLWFGLVFIFAVALIIANMIWAAWETLLRDIVKDKIQLIFYKKEAKGLTREEKEILREFIVHQTRSADFSIQDATVLGLEKRKFIIRVGNVGATGLGFIFPYNIQPWAWKYLNKHPKLLDIEK